MSTFKEENAITYRIAQMQKKWVDTVTPQTQLVRWLVKKDEVRMVKAFSMLEASEHGKLTELFLNFEQPFIGVEDYGKDLVHSWITLWNDQKSRDEVAHANVLPDWDDTPYHNIRKENSEWTFIKCMSSFATAIDPKIILVLNVMPQAYRGTSAFAEWVKKSLKILPSNLKLMVVDLESSQRFRDMPKYINEAILVPDLKMNEAIREIVSSGDTNNPAVGVNLCLLNMAEATNDGNEEQIQYWGIEGVKIAKETNLKSIEATVLIAHGSALYQLKKFQKAMDLFEKAEDTSIEGINEQDPSAPIVLLQSYNIQASTYLYKKDYTKALEYYIKTAAEAKSQNNIMMQIEACRQAAYVAARDYKKGEAYELLQQAYEEGKKVDQTTQKFSSMLLICIKLYEYADENKNEKLTKNIEEYATQIWGEQWKDLSQEEVYQQLLIT